MLLHLRTNDQFHSVNRVAHKIFRDVRSQRGLVHGAIATDHCQQSSTRQPCRLIYLARGLGNGGTNSFERICSRENIQGGCVTTALRIIVKLRSVDSSTAHVPFDD